MSLAAFAEEARPYGIDKRIPWTTSKITGSPEPPAPYRVVRRFPNLQFKDPVVLMSAPGTDRLFVVEVAGKIHSFPNDNACDRADLCFDMKGALAKMDQVYGLAFHPHFAQNRYCYVCYRTAAEAPDGTRVSRFEVSSTDPPRIDPTTEQVLITWLAGGHNGGCLAFGLDGYLYISSGDGGPAFPPDPLKSGQDVSTLLSTVMRINVDEPSAGRPYSIPVDNPFVNLAGARGEIWAYGFRNPWKISFDPGTGDLWVGDVGWELWEMIYRVERGANYGWSLVEGPQAVHRERERGPTPIVPPTVAHSHIDSRSITGGNVYRGSRLPDLVGAYVYGDYVTGKLWAFREKSNEKAQPLELADTSLPIVCFGVDNQQELYVVSYEGSIHGLEKNDSVAANASFPATLSATGLFARVADHAVAPGVIPYSIQAEPWMDGAKAERFVALPGTAKLGIHATSNVQIGYIKDTWSFPPDSVLMKTISLEMEAGRPESARRLETQILHFDVDTWRAYNYIWNEDQTDAELAPNQSTERPFIINDRAAPSGKSQQTWYFASRTECLLCHTTRGGTVYGFNPPQLDRDHDYGPGRDNQLRTLSHIGLFQSLAKEPSRRIVSPYEETANLEERARAYLHVNCAHCHRRGGGGTAAMDVQYQLQLEKTNLLEARPTQGTFGIHAAQVLAAGDPFRSVLYYRMAKLGRGRMPYIGSSVVDVRGLRLMHDWIGGLRSANRSPNENQDRNTTRDKNNPQLRLASLFEQVESSRAKELVEEALSSTAGALALQFAMDDVKLPSTVRGLAIEVGTQHPDVQVRDLFERYLSEERRTRRLGAAIDRNDILKLAGDPSRGRKLYLETAGVQCKSCHPIAGQGTLVGPDLTEIGKKYTRTQLLESLLEPSKTIDPKYLTHLIETTDGRVMTGLLVSRDDRAVVLKDTQAKEIRVSASDILYFTPQQKSLMPELQLQDMTAGQVADLLAFLASLR